MVRKLFHYEFRAFARAMMPMQAILLGIGLLCRLVQVFEADNLTYRIFFVSSCIALGIACVTCLIMTVCIAVSRYYKNLFTAEGYLSFTLPVTKDAHILSKLLVALVFSFGSLLAVVLALCAATAGEMLLEIGKAIGYLIGQYFSWLGWNGAGYAAEALIWVILFIANIYLLLYACISLGQLAKKNRILAAFGVYFAYYLITQIIGTVLVVVATVVLPQINFAPLIEWISANAFAAGHLLMAGVILLTAILTAFYWLVSHLAISKRLNLE